MADAVAAVIGSVLMIAFLSAIASKLAETSLWVVCLLAIGLMIWAFWKDEFAPLFRHSRRN